jgi:glycosyltransferase involved in cell wall biosynthesis
VVCLKRKPLIKNMPKISVNILTKNRKDQLQKAIESVLKQSFKDYEIIVVNDGSTDKTEEIILRYKDIKVLRHETSIGITQSRQEALEASQGEYVAILDDDDEWIDTDKLKKQVELLDKHNDYVLVGGGVRISNINPPAGGQISKFRPKTDSQIRNWMLLKNPFFTSTVMFRKSAAFKAGGFKKDQIDLGEDYDLWLRMGLLGKLHNFQEVFTFYRESSYNKAKFKLFLKKQLKLITAFKSNYPFFWLSNIILRLRLML